jgi:phenol 2-monooxygenase (NADPH)
VKKYQTPGFDIDSFIEVILVLSGERLKTEQEIIPGCFWPATGKYQMRGTLIEMFIQYANAINRFT